MEEDLKRFIGKTIKTIQKRKGLCGYYYTLVFEDDTKLSAIDGEYGDDAFYIGEQEDIITEELK